MEGYISALISGNMDYIERNIDEWTCANDFLAHHPSIAMATPINNSAPSSPTWMQRKYLPP